MTPGGWPDRTPAPLTGVFVDHLGLDAVVAYVDGELGLTAFQRASAHLVRCPQCAGEVAEQEAMARCLRSAELPRMPGSLFDALASIPLAAPGPAPAPGLTLDPHGRAYRHVPKPPEPGLGRRFRLGAGALVAGLAVGAVVVAAAEHPHPPRPGPAPHLQQSVSTGGPDAVTNPAHPRH